MKEFEGRIAVVTGASRGLGRSMAIDLGRRGATVVCNYVSDSSTPLAEETLDQIREAGGDGMIYQTDVSDNAAVQKMFMAVFKAYKKVDFLINNAGLTRDEYFMVMRPDSWKRLMEVHLDAIYYCTKAVIRQMCAAKKGVIVNIGSGSAVVAMPGQVNYSATKAGLFGFTRSLAREVADKGVRVMHIAPGFFKSEMSDVLTSEFIKETFRVTPLGRWGLADELSKLVSFVCSDDAAYLTGQTITIDGGRNAVEPDVGFVLQ
ncbi:MAG: SDR family oxidoreductase [Pirellulaceae bacterium]|nr:SDR family oxidoreductase [Pirellulaceae bacterium]